MIYEIENKKPIIHKNALILPQTSIIGHVEIYENVSIWFGAVLRGDNDKIYVDDINSDTAPSYTVMAANIGYVWKNADWKINTFARVDNLLDKDYVGSVIVNDGNKRFFEPADGRNWSAGLKMIRSF